MLLTRNHNRLNNTMPCRISPNDDNRIPVLRAAPIITLATGLMLLLTFGFCIAGPLFAADSPPAAEFIIGTEKDYPPFSFCQQDGRPTGFNIDLIHAVASVTGLNIQIKYAPWNEIYRELEQGTVQAIAGMYPSAKRREIFDFSSPFSKIDHVVFHHRSDRSIFDIGDLAGQDVLVMKNDIMHDYLLEHRIDGNPALADTPSQAVELLAADRHAYYLGAKLPGLYWIQKSGAADLVSSESLLAMDYCFAVPKGNADLLHHLEEGLALIQTSGRYREIYDQWLGALEKTAPPKPLTPIKIGVLAKRGSAQCLQQWGLTADFLNRELPGHQFQIVPLEFDQVVPAVRDYRADFLLTNSAQYVELETAGRIRGVVTLINSVNGKATTQFAGVIFCRADRDDIRKIEHLKDKSFMAVDPYSFGGWLMALRELRERRIDPDRDFSSLLFGETHDAVVYAVLNQSVDAGTVRSDTLERMAEEGKIRLDDLKILNPQKITDELPFLHSTRSYPEWSLAKLASTPEELAKQVAGVLMHMPADSPPAKAAGSAGWTFVQNYQPVHECLKDLRHGPYADYGKISWITALRHYWLWIAAAGGLILSLLVLTVWAARINQKLLLANQRQTEEIRLRNTVEKKLRHSEQKYRNLYEHISVGVALISPRMEVLDLNHRMKQWFPQVDPEQRPLCYRAFNDPAPDGPCGHCPVIKTLRDGLLHEEVTETPTPGGIKHFRIVSTPLLDDNGRVVAVIEMVDDITELVKIQKLLQQSESQLRAITDAAQDAILMMDSRGNISYWNPAAQRILGYSSEEAMGQNLHRLLAPARYWEAHQNAFPEFLRSGAGNAVGKTLELQALRKDGAEITIAMSLSAVQLNGSWHAVGILRDITELKQAREELLQTNRYLEEATAFARDMATQAEMANLAKTEFLANMSHEIRTPMNAILGFSDLLAEEQFQPHQVEYIQIIKQSGHNLLRIIDDILDLSKIETGKMDLEMLDCSLTEILQMVFAMLQPKAAQKGLDFQILCPPETPDSIHTDPIRLKQCLINLVNNAIKFTETGHVHLHVSCRESQDRPMLSFEVEDTGIGISAEKLQLIFEPFSQADSSTTRKYGGTGLGLTITKKLAVLLGGDIRVQSEPGRGSRFTLTLPYQPHQEPSTADESPAVHPTETPACRLSDARILVAEDNPTNQILIEILLKKIGLHPVLVSNGRLAVDQALAESFDLILMDMQMPVMNGYEAVALLRKKGVRIPIIALTASAMKHDEAKCLEAGCDAYLTKPINLIQLQNALEPYLALSPAI